MKPRRPPGFAPKDPVLASLPCPELLPGFRPLGAVEDPARLDLARLDPPALADVIAARHGWPVMLVWLALDRLVTNGRAVRVKVGDRILYGRAPQKRVEGTP